MCTSTPKAPPPPPAVPEAPRMPDQVSQSTNAAKDRRRRGLSTGTGARSTILTGSRGVTDSAPVLTKTLLGQ